MRPNIEALNHQGYPYIRPARSIGELPSRDARIAALDSATATIAKLIGLAPERRIPFGLPAYSVFMTRPEAVKHPHAKLLLTPADQLTLDLCPEYN